MAKSDEEKKASKSSSTKKIKYMGSSDRRDFKASDNFGGRLPDGLGVDLVFDEENNHIQEVDLDEDAYELFMGQQERDGSGGFFPAFKDVTGMRRVPDNEWAKRWRPNGLSDARSANAIVNETGQGVVTSGLGEGSTATSGTGSTGA